jgi:Tfp pilus assembly protein PilX
LLFFNSNDAEALLREDEIQLSASQQPQSFANAAYHAV